MLLYLREKLHFTGFYWSISGDKRAIITGFMKYFSVEFHGVGLEYIEEFEDLFKSHGQGFNAIKSRVKKEQISPKLFRNQFNPW